MYGSSQLTLILNVRFDYEDQYGNVKNYRLDLPSSRCSNCSHAGASNRASNDHQNNSLSSEL